MLCPAGHPTLPFPTTAHPQAGGPLGRGGMVEQADTPMPSDNRDPYMAVPSQTQQDANGKPWNRKVNFSCGRDEIYCVCFQLTSPELKQCQERTNCHAPEREIYSTKTLMSLRRCNIQTITLEEKREDFHCIYFHKKMAPVLSCPGT